LTDEELMAEDAQTRITFYVDGACSGNHSRDLTGFMGAGIVGIAGKVRKEWAVPLGPGTNQRAEVLAVKEALRRVKDRSRTQVHVVSDSEYARNVLVGTWKPKSNLDAIAEAKALIRECASFQMTWTKGHANTPGNLTADKLAVKASQMAMAEALTPHHDPPES
jgi:ribonuclease HI